MTTPPLISRLLRASVVAATLWSVGAPCGALHAQQSPAGSLTDALQRERALLAAEAKQLRAQQKASAQESQQRIDALRQKVDRQRAQYEASWARVLALERELRELDAKLETVPTPQGDSLAALEPLRQRLQSAAPAAPGPNADTKDLAGLMAQAAAQLTQASRVRTKQGVFFLPDGTRTQGTVVLVGEVAAAGVDAQGQGGALVPVRGKADTYQVLELNGAQVRAYLDGKAATLPLWTYDPQNPPDPAQLELGAAPEQAPPRTWRDTVADAAPVGYVILALGMLAALILLARLLALGRMALTERRAGRQLLTIMHEHHDTRDLTGLQTYARAHDTALSRVTLQALSHGGLPLELYENSIQATLIVELGRVGRGLSALRAIAAVSPLLGLLGTVIGMIATFEALTATGSASNPQALSGGIAQALATTQLGLIVAVPALLAYSGLRGWASRLETYIEHVAVEISTHIRELSLEGHDHAHHQHHGDDH